MSGRSRRAPVRERLSAEIMLLDWRGSCRRSLTDIAHAVGVHPKTGSLRNALGELARARSLYRDPESLTYGRRRLRLIQSADPFADLGPERPLPDAPVLGWPAPPCRCGGPLVLAPDGDETCLLCGRCAA
jgi:hypothetical protein